MKKLIPLIVLSTLIFTTRDSFANELENSYQDSFARKEIISERGKPLCQDLSKSYIQSTYSPDITHISFVQIVNSRQRIYPKGTKIADILNDDYEFSYEPIEDWIRKLQFKNGIRENQLTKDQLIVLPFCQSSKEDEKIPEMIEEVAETEEAPKENPIEEEAQRRRKPSLSLSTQVGLVNSTNSDNEKLSMTLFKVGAKYTMPVFSEYNLSVSAAITKFININYPETEATANSSFLPEFGVGINKMKEKWILGIGYDMLNYLLSGTNTTEVVIDPKTIHRLAFKPAYIINSNLLFFSGLGYFSNLDSAESITGPDVSLGVAYTFGNKRRYTLAGLVYQALITTKDGDEQSNVVLASFGVKIF